MRSQPRLHTLIVDDDRHHAQEIARLLTAELGPASICGDADHALALLEGRGFDALVVEVALPGATGIDLLQCLRRPLPAVVVTALFSEPVVARAREVGASAVLRKPVDGDRLVAALRSAVAAGSQRSTAVKV